jgi:DNA-binding MarR family transcriptional regulator/predicted N-acetyltransferase YhbS
MDPSAGAPADRVAALRAFNRFYTRRIGVLHERLHGSEFTLPQSRLLWELAHNEQGLSAATLARELDLDPGYLSRLLRTLRERGLVRAVRSQQDGRQSLLTLTAAGQRAFSPVDEGSRHEMAALLTALPDADQQRLLDALSTAEALLRGQPSKDEIVLRPLQPGDVGWVVARHGVLYAHEYGWDMRFEALVARIAADFVEGQDPAHEAAWIAERRGSPIGCVFLVQARDETSHEPDPGVAQLRLLLVEPSARGLGLGKRLVDECTRFSRAAGYRRIRLWTNSVLLAARGIYQRAGYRLVTSEPHHSFGHDLVGETWELQLQ